MYLQPRIPVEQTFNAFVKSIGGELVSELFPGSPPFKNADYYFREANVIAELKCLETDPSTDPKKQAKVQALYDSWRQRRDKVPLIFGKATISTSMLPEKNARELVDVFRKPINERLRDANRQIKETREQLGATDAFGVLLLVNESNLAFEHGPLIHLLVNILRAPGYRGINAVIYFTVNLLAAAPWTNEPTLLWFPFARENMPSPAPEFINLLEAKWRKYLEDTIGLRFDEHELNDPAKVHEMKHMK